MAYLETDLVIISSGAVLPQAENPEEFFQILLDGKTCLTDLREMPDLSYRPLYHLMHRTDRAAPVSTYSTLGAAIPRQKVQALAERHGLDLSTSLAFHVTAVEAVSQCLQGTLSDEEKKQTDLIFGVPDVLPESFLRDASVAFEEIENIQELAAEKAEISKCFEQEISRLANGRESFPPKEASIVSRLSEKICRHFQLGGSSFLVDAACASSFAALEIAKFRLEQGHCRYAVVGAVEGNLGSVSTMIGFSKLGVLSEKPPLPFDSRSEGIAFGEGAVSFVVTTMRQALADKKKILGVIKGIGGSSDGKSGGLTEPTLEGQMLCYRNTYGARGPADVSYIECHGTGTKVGDRVEISSLTQFFGDRSAPIGSVKHNMGHTMACAGGVSLLKGLKILQHGVIPPSPYFEKFPPRIKTNLFMNTKPLPLAKKSAPHDIAISAFGFGGTNFHLWLQEFKPEAARALAPAPVKKMSTVVLCAQVEAGVEQVPELFSSTAYHIPPKIWPWIDRVQLLSVLLAEKLFRDLGIRTDELDLSKMHVIAGTAQPLLLSREMARRGMYTYAFRLLEEKLPKSAEKLREVYEVVVEDMAEINEQSTIGSINNLVASRVSKAFDFKGLNFAVDGDQSAGLKALESARMLLEDSPGAAVVFEAFKEVNPRGKFLQTTGMRCYLLASQEFALENSFPILAEVSPMAVEGRS